MKKIIVASICMIMILLVSGKNIYAQRINEITVSNNVSLTESKEYPFINIKNNTNRDIMLNYYVYIDKQEAEHKQEDVVLRANGNIVLEILELHHLGEKGLSRRVWFSWEKEGIRKSLESQIDTHVFKIKQVEIG